MKECVCSRNAVCIRRRILGESFGGMSFRNEISGDDGSGRNGAADGFAILVAIAAADVNGSIIFLRRLLDGILPS